MRKYFASIGKKERKKLYGWRRVKEERLEDAFTEGVGGVPESEKDKEKKNIERNTEGVMREGL